MGRIGRRNRSRPRSRPGLTPPTGAPRPEPCSAGGAGQSSGPWTARRPAVSSRCACPRGAGRSCGSARPFRRPPVAGDVFGPPCGEALGAEAGGDADAQAGGGVGDVDLVLAALVLLVVPAHSLGDDNQVPGDALDVDGGGGAGAPAGGRPGAAVVLTDVQGRCGIGGGRVAGAGVPVPDGGDRQAEGEGVGAVRVLLQVLRVAGRGGVAAGTGPYSGVLSRWLRMSRMRSAWP